MRIKKFQARSFSEALSKVKKELGSDAVILSSEEIRGGKPQVEVTAAVEYDLQDRDVTYDAPELARTHTGELGELKKELKSLRLSVDAIRKSTCELGLPERQKEMMHFLKEKLIEEDFALKLAERAQAMEDLDVLMAHDIDRLGSARKPAVAASGIMKMNKQKITMLIGPTGSGKTTTIAKLATQAVRERRKVALVGVDTFKIGAAEQIRIYSRMIGIPLEIVSSTRDLPECLRKLSDRDLILIDTTGRNPKDEDYITELMNVYHAGISLETHLLLSASSDSAFLRETQKHYGALPIDCIAFTKTDEAIHLGSLYNLCQIYGKPVAYITTGQKVPGNIEFVDGRRLTNLILKTGSA